MWNTLSEFYTSREWSEFRRRVILSRGTVCEYCGEEIVRPYDLILHHVKHLTLENVNDYEVSLNEDNVQIVHHRCHNEIHERFGNAGRHIYLVYGSPCSGKTSFVRETAGVNDIVIDMDSIYECISINPRYIKPASLSSVAFAVRDCLLDMVRTRSGKWNNAFLVGGYPRESERERLCRMYGAEEVFIDETYERCMTRACERPDWTKYVERWFEDYTPTLP